MIWAYFVPEMLLLGSILAIGALGLAESLSLLQGALYGALVGALWCSLEAWSGNQRHSKLRNTLAGAAGSFVGVVVYLMIGEPLLTGSAEEFTRLFLYRGVASTGAERDVFLVSLICGGMALVVFRSFGRWS